MTTVYFTAPEDRVDEDYALAVEVSALMYAGNEVWRDWAVTLRGDAATAVRDGLQTWADAATTDAGLLRWAAADPSAAALRERWAVELADAARAALAPVIKWKDPANRDRDAVPQPLSDERLLELGGGEHPAPPIEAGAVLAALSDETRAEVVETIGARVTTSAGWAAAWREWLAWLGVGVSTGGGLVAVVRPPSRDPFVPIVALKRVEPRYLRALLKDLWAARWRDEADRVRRKPAALLVPVHEGVGAFLVGLRARPADPRQLVLPGLVQAPGAVALGEALHRLAQSGGAAVLAHRIVRSLVAWGAMVHAVGEGRRVLLADGVEGQRTAGGVVELWVEGGLDWLRSAVGSRSKNDAPRPVLDALAAGTVAWATDTAWGRSPLLTWREDRATAGRPAVLSLTLGELLLPGVASAAGVAPRDRVLVPVLPAPALPRGPRFVAGALALDWALTRNLADLRHELREHGSVALDPVTVGREIGVGAPLVNACMELWMDDTTGRWTSPAPGRLRLVDRGPEGEAHRLLIEGAERSEAARARVARRRR